MNSELKFIAFHILSEKDPDQKFLITSQIQPKNYYSLIDEEWIFHLGLKPWSDAQILYNGEKKYTKTYKVN